MMKAWRTLLAVWGLWLPWVVSAGTLRLYPEAHVEFTNGLPEAVVQIANLGDEPFRLLSVDARLQGLEAQALPGNFLVPGETTGVRLGFPPLPYQTNETPAVIRIHYAHANGNSYSALALAPVPVEQPPPEPWVAGRFSPASIGRSGNISLQLLLLKDQSADVTVKLILPDEFSCGSWVRKVILEPDARRVETFELVNQSAVPGSTYPVFALVERTLNGMIQCTSVTGEVTIVQTKWIGQSYWFWAGLALALLVGLGWWAVRYRKNRDGQFSAVGYEAALLLILSAFIIWQLSPGDWMRNTTPVGGDTPAHLYLVSHLKEQLLQHRRIISWAGGWWCGFPMFQYYFVLPYLAAVLLSVLIPLNIAFKLVSVGGMVLTPCCAYWAAKEWRMPGPGPVLLALAMVPFIFVQSHTMWGVNAASTLAGMIANSWSFALMLPALAFGMRDVSEGVVRRRTILLFVSVLASHFFTSVIMFVTLAIVPFFAFFPCRQRFSHFCRGVRVLGVEAGIAVMLMGWWLVPLIAKAADSMDFGVNWELSLMRSFPEYAVSLLVFSGVAIVAGIKRSLPVVWLLFWMGLVSVVLFKAGFFISPVFVNVRLWPFIFFALMALGAVGLGVMLERSRGGMVVVGLLVPAVLGAVMISESIGGLGGAGLTHSWAKWNFAGLEGKPSAAVFEKLLPLLKGTPGRLANDLCEENNQLGSSRIFELVPHLIGKPILEGGLVNSALGSIYSYYIQGETSPSCAGFPPMVKPTTFDFARATRHLELFNVKHFIARSSLARQALKLRNEWRLVACEQEWELYELMTHEGRYVFIPPRLPLVVETSRWKDCSLEWLYTPEADGQFLLWKMPGMKLDRPELVILDEPHVMKALADLRQTNSSCMMPLGKPLLEAGTRCISEESIADDRIHFKTRALGAPHIIKVTWFPNWKVHGAKQVYCISPGFMCVFPDQADVELYYGTTWSDVVGYILTIAGCCSFAAFILMRRRC